MACCGLRRRARTITRAAGAVATIIRLEVRAGAPGAAVPVVTGGPKTGLGAGVAGGRCDPRPQQQNIYNGAGSRMGHGEYVQLTWLVSGEICNAVQIDGPQPLDFENRWSWGAVFAVESTSGRALSTFSQSDSESESESDGVCTRVVRELEIASSWCHYS